VIGIVLQPEKAKVFMTGRSQAVRIPAQYRFKTEEVYIRQDPKTGEITLSERPEQPSLSEIFKMIDAAGEAEGAYDLSLDREPEPSQEREWM
jgi:antitoxin VapB